MVGFFAGRRFVPIVTAFASVAAGIVAGFVWPPIGQAIQSFGDAIVTMGAIGLILYGFANRMLLLVGLHHILNTFVWFQLGSFTKADGTVVNGDLNRFFAGDPTAGAFMAGWFVVMMFGLPAAAYAIYNAADSKVFPNNSPSTCRRKSMMLCLRDAMTHESPPSAKS